MRANQRMIASDGYEVMLFPLEYMYITQGEGGSTSHDGTLNIDFQGYGANGRIYDCPMYAPCSLRVVAEISSSNNGRVYESLNKVHTPNGLQYVSFILMHDENPPTVGLIFAQGDLFAHTGTAGYVTGDHTHMNTANGKYVGYHTVNTHIQLDNTTHIYDICYVNDTVLVQDYGYNWKIYSGGIGLKKNKFNWVLFSKHKRNKK